MEQLKKLGRYPLLVAFAGFTLVFSIWDTQVNDRVFSDFENRYLTRKPAFSWKSLMENEFTPKYEKYINDQFVLRDDWIALKAICETALGKIENNGIVYGRDGYLFEKYRQAPTEQLQKNLTFVRRFLDANPNLPVTLAVVPNSYTILEDKVPARLKNVDQRAAIGEIYRQLDGVGSLRTLDLTAPLEAHRQEEIFYRTDHHWTTRGAWVGYAAYVKSLGMTPVPLEELPPIPVEEFRGTYFNKAKNPGIAAETIYYYDIPVTETLVNGEPVDGYYDREKWAERDKYAAFLRGNQGYMVLKSAVNRAHVSGETSKVLVVKDSYANSLVPFLLYDFDEVHVVDLRANATPMSQLLAEGEFDQVLLLYNFMNFASDTNFFRLTY